MIYIGRLIDADKLINRLEDLASYEKLDYIQEVMDEPIAFNIDMVFMQLEDYGKYKGILKCDGNNCENYIPISMAKQIVRGRGLGGVLGYLEENNKVVKDCSTCKNNVEYPPPHTCDICMSLDHEEEYDMWEGKE